MNRKWIAIVLSAVLLLSLSVACGRKNTVNDGNLNNGVTNPNNDMNNGVNNGVNGNERPGSDLNGNGPTDTNTQPGGTASNNGTNGKYPTFPNSLATTDADVAVDDLIATLGLTETDLNTAMRDVSTVGDGVDGARTYRHKLLGHEADVSYGFDPDRAINKVTVKTQKDYAEDWRREFNDTLKASAVEGKTDTWDYSNSSVKMTEEGDHFIITIEKPKA